MTVNQAFQYELDPNNRQRTGIVRHAGAARFAFNWGLGLCKLCLDLGRKVPGSFELHRLWNIWKRTEVPWWAAVSKCAPQEALRDLAKAFGNFFSGKAGFPRFRKKFEDDRFRLTGAIKVLPRHVILPRLGKIRVKEDTGKFRGRILSATVSREADRWFVSLAVEVERADPVPVQGGPVGVDLGLKCFAVLSDGTKFEAPKPLKRLLRKLQKLSKAHSRKKKGSANRRKPALALARLHRKIANIRRDFLHKLSTELAKTKPVIVAESLRVKDLLKAGHGPEWDRRINRAVMDSGFGMFRTMLGYKTEWYGSLLILAPENFPSTRTCSGCGTAGPELPVSRRIFRCGTCGLEMDRDLNAAKNLVKLAG